jgi:hypothetical protein
MPAPIPTAATSHPFAQPLRRIGLAAALLLVAGAAVGAAPPLPWLCTLSEDSLRLVCVHDTDPGAEPAGAGTGPATTAVVHGTRFPLDPAQVYTVDLLAPATDADWLDQLARATLCYRSPGCTVLLSGLGDLLPAKRPSAARLAQR